MRQHGLALEGSPAHLLHTALLDYFPEKEGALGNLWLLDAPFDVHTDSQAEHYRDTIDVALRNVIT